MIKAESIQTIKLASKQRLFRAIEIAIERRREFEVKTEAGGREMAVEYFAEDGDLFVQLSRSAPPPKLETIEKAVERDLGAIPEGGDPTPTPAFRGDPSAYFRIEGGNHRD